MKKVLLSCAAVTIAIAALAQEKTAAVKQATTAPYVETPLIYDLLPVNLSDKAANDNYYVDYQSLNTSNDYVPGTTYYSYFQVNTAAAASDSLFTNISVGLKPYIGFTDYQAIGASAIEPDLQAANGTIRIDSLFGLFTHSNYSGNNNKLIFTIRQGVQYDFGGDIVEGPTNTILWADTIQTTTTLSPNGLADGAPSGSLVDYAKAVGISRATSGTGFVITFTTVDLAVNDTVQIFCLSNAASPSSQPNDPYVWNTTAVRSSTPTSIGLFYASAGLWAKVTYTNSASIATLDNLGFTIHNFMPNPAKESTVIAYELKTPGDVKFVITDMAGRQVSMINLNNQSTGTQYYTLNTADFASGYYNVAMQVNGQVFTQKLSVVK